MMDVLSEWRHISLGDVVTFQRGFDITKAQQRPGDCPVISSSGTHSFHDEAKACGPGIVIGRKGTLGSVFYSEGDYWPHDTTLWSKDLHGNHPKFVYYLLRTLQLEQYDAGASNPSLNRNHIHLIPVYVPSVLEQMKIAAILSAYDDLIENNTRRIKILEEMARTSHRDWLLKIGPATPSTNGAVANEDRLPVGWVIRKLGDLAQEKRHSVDPGEVPADSPYVGLEHIPRRSLALSVWGRAADVGSTKLLFQAGDILFGKIRPYFHKVIVAPIDGVCSSDAIVIRPRRDEWLPLVACCVFSDEFVIHATQTSNGTKMPRANWSVLVDYPVPVPPRDILNKFNLVVGLSIEQIRNLTLRNRTLRETRDLLLPKLISGGLDVSDLAIATDR